MRRRLAIGAAVLLLGCSKEEPMGPPGPAGPQGPPRPAGPPGAIDRADFTGTIGASGGVAVTLPAGAVANNRVPVIACYVSDDRRTWLAVAQVPPQDGFPFCGLSNIGTSNPSVVLVDAPSGVFYYIIAAL